MKRHGEFHSITSSARASSVGGMVRPISLAVKIDDELKSGRKLNRHIDGPGTLEQLVDIACRSAVEIDGVGGVRHHATLLGEKE
jgi:hypothetical protein